MTLMETAQLLGNFGEFFGAIAVVATLAYLAVQIRRSTVQSRLETYDSYMAGYTDVFLVLAADKDASLVLRTGLSNPDSLGAPEQEQFNWLVRSYMLQHYKTWRMYQQGVVPREDWVGNATDAVAMLDTPGGERWRETALDPSWEFFIDELKQFAAPREGGH